VIQSVLDVKDDSPLPRSAGPQQPFNRSILILTPARALKFTATSRERHYIWLTALSFLSQSGQAVNDLRPIPHVPPPSFEPPVQAVSRIRRPIRDSIRLAKGKDRPTPRVPPPIPVEPIHEIDYTNGPYDAGALSDHAAAEPPNVPRYGTHGRKRSNTGSRAGDSSFRSFSHSGVPVPSYQPSYSIASGTNSDYNGYGVASVMSTGPMSVSTRDNSFSRQTSEASAIPPSLPPVTVMQTNFFDAVGTVRMEAFVDKNASVSQRASRISSHNPRRSKGSMFDEQAEFTMDIPAAHPYRMRKERWNASLEYPYAQRDDVVGLEEFLNEDDPFGGF
jgi:Meiotic cell cortex C-terminal pleckstrin homology